ncbi:hypothetical protein Trydic_g3441 [Trypoxylus dichotomus]
MKLYRTILYPKLFGNRLHRLIHTCCILQKKIPSNLKGKGVSSQQWLVRQLNDPYVEKAKLLNYRCRSAFKLLEIDDKYKFLKPGSTVIDCGAAPGSWTQVAVNRVFVFSNPSVPKGLVIAIDKQYIHPIENAIILGNSDFTQKQAQDKIFGILGKTKANVVLSDMAPNATGIKEIDIENMLNLCYSALRFAVQVSENNATFLVKLWYCNDLSILEKDIQRFYGDVKIVKPKASRDDSAEVFILGRYFKGLVSDS